MQDKKKEGSAIGEESDDVETEEMIKFSPGEYCWC